MRLIFMYHAINQGSGPIDLSKKATNQYVLGVKEEGYFFLLERMLQEGVVDEILLIMESTRGVGKITYAPNFEGWVIPDIDQLDPYLRDDDVIWCRGGHRSNFAFLNRAKERGNWLLLYAANTGRQRWKFWDVILNDLDTKNTFDRHRRLWLSWAKPVNTKVFKPLSIERKYDLCIGASYIHDKKGQWRAIKALIEYKKIWGATPKCILPGAIRRGTYSNNIHYQIDDHKLDVYFPKQHLPRTELNTILNQSKIFIHAGASGQNDRGPLEAMRCGCQLIIGSPDHHSPYVIYHPYGCTPASNDPKDIAKTIHAMIVSYREEMRALTTNFHAETHGMDDVVLPHMARLFSVFKQNPKRNTEALRREYGL